MSLIITDIENYSLTHDTVNNVSWDDWVKTVGAGTTITKITYAQYRSEGGEPVVNPPSHVAKISTNGVGQSGHDFRLTPTGVVLARLRNAEGFQMRMYLPKAHLDKTHISSWFTPRLYIDGSNRRNYNVSSRTSGHYTHGLVNESWQHTDAEYSRQSSDTGTYTQASCAYVDLKFVSSTADSDSGDPLICYILDVTTTMPRTPIVVFTFDDGSDSHVTEVLPASQTYNIPWTAFVVPALLTDEVSNFMSPAQVNSLVDSGLVDLGMHGVEGAEDNYEALTTAQLRTELDSQYAAIVSKGLYTSGFRSFLAWPEGLFAIGTTDGGDIWEICKEYGIKFFRGSGLGCEVADLGSNRSSMRSLSLGSGANQIENGTDIGTVLDMIEATHQDIIIRGHKVELSPSTTADITPTELDGIFSEVYDRREDGKIRTMNMSQYAAYVTTLANGGTVRNSSMGIGL